MKLVTYTKNRTISCGLLTENTVIDIPSTWPDPYLLTADEVADVQNLNLELKVNGGSRQKANTSQMIYPVREIVIRWV